MRMMKEMEGKDMDPREYDRKIRNMMMDKGMGRGMDRGMGREMDQGADLDEMGSNDYDVEG